MTKDEIIAQKDREISRLKQELAQLKKLIYGFKSERLVSSDGAQQLSLFDSETPATASPDLPQQHISYNRRKPNHKGRNPLPDNVPVEEIVIEPENVPQGAKHIGNEVTETIDYQPASLIKRRTIRPKYVLPDTEQIVIAELPTRPLPKSIAEAGLLVHLAVSKLVDHLPFYRQSQQFKREYNWRLSPNTIYHWFSEMCDLLQPLFDTLRQQIRQSKYLQADESPLKVLDKNKKGKTHQGYMWVYRDPLQRLVLFDYSKTRGKTGPKEILKDFEGTLQCDGWQVYDKIAKTMPHVHLAGCIVHMRRKFYDAQDSDPHRAQYALKLFAKIYKLEKDTKLAQDKTKYRKEHIQPILEQLRQWIDQESIKVLPKSAIGKAMSYAINQWSKIMHIFTDGNIELDNNLIENKIRPLALGRKNYLFAGCAKNLAMMYSFFATCKEHDVNPRKWLEHTINNIANTKISALEQLLPHKFKQTLDS